ncbi:hypothetical protein UFOVP81_22 [uncultured Caudovirales phage]|uniref:Uncharacterized protein n=1 Tax=uncultured Caudovirales phage TaxID=2100421 RepID=A0A6J5L441_9CAUD|nr:hypothetical protein UFOVP81_22 [uncultured Caudovirales phage]
MQVDDDFYQYNTTGEHHRFELLRHAYIRAGGIIPNQKDDKSTQSKDKSENEILRSAHGTKQ